MCCNRWRQICCTNEHSRGKGGSSEAFVYKRVAIPPSEPWSNGNVMCCVSPSSLQPWAWAPNNDKPTPHHSHHSHTHLHKHSRVCEGIVDGQQDVRDEHHSGVMSPCCHQQPTVTLGDENIIHPHMIPQFGKPYLQEHREFSKPEAFGQQ